MDENLLREIISRILYRTQKTPWEVLGKQLAKDLGDVAAAMPSDEQTETILRCGIAAELWQLYGPGEPVNGGDTLDPQYAKTTTCIIDSLNGIRIEVFQDRAELASLRYPEGNPAGVWNSHSLLRFPCTLVNAKLLCDGMNAVDFARAVRAIQEAQVALAVRVIIKTTGENAQ